LLPNGNFLPHGNESGKNLPLSRLISGGSEKTLAFLRIGEFKLCSSHRPAKEEVA
jgi:hypothetical protein